METKNVKAIKFDGYKIELSENRQGKPVASLSKFMTRGHFAGNYKRIEGYYFHSEERRTEWIKEKMTNIKANIASDKANKEETREARKNFVNPYKVGEIYYDSWGYDQTNIDFYEIIEVKGKTVKLQKIGGEIVEATGPMSANVKPNPKGRGKIFTKVIQIRVRDGKISHHLKSDHGWISKYDAGEKGVYQSWYH